MIIYTCVTGGYDWLSPPLFHSKDIRYICFTDRPNMHVAGWDIMPIEPGIPYPKRMIARRYKLFPWDYLPPHDVSLWIDGRIRVLSDPRPLIGPELFSNADVYVPAHSCRTNIWDELDDCILTGKINGHQIQIAKDRLAFYESDGYTKTNLLAESGILFRAGDPTDIRKAMELWWDELFYFVGRDQISLPYVSWKENLDLALLEITAYRPNPYFAIVEHRKGASTRSYLRAKQYDGKAWRLTYQALQKASRIIKSLSKS